MKTRILRKIIIVFIAILYFTSISFSQTEVSGTIPFNTTWTLDLSPYSVIGDVQIPDGVTLAIEPGVEIKYTGAYEILVNGTIIANGTVDDSISFTTSTPGISSGATMLRFVETNLANSQLSYVKMEWASKAIFTDAGNTDTLSVYHMQLLHNTITQGTNSYTSPRGTGSIYLSNALISNATIEVGNSFFKIDSSNISDASVSLTYASSNAALVINRCSLTNVTTYSSRDAWSQYMKIIESTLNNSAIRSGSINCEISECTLINSPIEGFTGGTLTVSNTTINYSGDYGINCNTGDYSKNCIIDSSQITGNGTGIAININNGSISNSEINNNSIAVKISPNQHVNSVPGNTISNCKFTDNSTYNVENRTTNSITATDNWWGTIDVANIKGKIWDYYDDINYGKVVFSPLLMTQEGPSNYVPVVDVLVNPLLGRVPLTVTFTASATDPDGTIELYEWDFDGDGTYDWNSAENGDTTYTYTIGNYYTTELKVVDNQGLANRLFYKIAVLDFDIEAEQQNDMVILGWGWGKFQTVIILPSALSFLNIGDEIHIVDKTGLITETCPVDETDIGIISVSHRTYVSRNAKYIFHCVGSIKLCDFNNTIRPGYVDGNPIYFNIYDSNEDVYYEIIPETIESGLCVFGDTTAKRTVISSFTKLLKRSSTDVVSTTLEQTKSSNNILGTEQNEVYFNVYRNNQLLASSLIDQYYIDTNLVPQTDYFYEIFLVDQNGNILLSESDSVTTDVPVPVELSFFTAIEINNSVILNWQTITEINNYGFSLERKSLDKKWEEICFVEGHGNSNSPKEYSFVDKDNFTGVIKYRLKQIDIDGDFEYSDVVTIELVTPKEFKLSQNYPNPFNPTTSKTG